VTATRPDAVPKEEQETMPLDLIVDSIDSVPEVLRGEYAEKDGKFHLNVNGLEDTAGLKSALKKERDAAAKATKDAKALSEKVARWESLGKTDTEIQEMLEKTAAAEAEALKKSGNFDAILADTRKKAEDALKARETKWSEEKAALENELNLARTSERGAIIETSVNNALVKAKATPEGLDLLTERLGRRIKIETVDGERSVTIMQADGKSPMAGNGKDGTATFDDLIKEAVEKWPSLFEGSGAGGGGKSSRDAGAGGVKKNTMKRADFDTLNVYEQAARMKAGVNLVD
jgi:hypothetical protein